MPTDPTPGGVVLTFDMLPWDAEKNPYGETAASWKAGVFLPDYATLLDVLEKYNARATFLVQRFDIVYDDPEWLSLLKDIVAKGHEIGSHTVSHGVWGGPKDPIGDPNGPKWDNAWNYFLEQVYPNWQAYDRLRTEKGLDVPEMPRSFGYPNTISGAAIDDVLLQFFKHLRGCPDGACWEKTMGPLSAEKVKTTGTIAGAWLDNAPIGRGYWGTYSTQWLPKAFNDGEFVTFASHLPDWSGRANRASPWWINYFLKYVNDRSPGIFKCMGDLASDFGLMSTFTEVDTSSYEPPVAEFVPPEWTPVLQTPNR